MRIDKGIPIPATSGRGGTSRFLAVEIGDSFESNATCAAMANQWARRNNNGRVFTTRKQPDGTFRTWRVK